MCITVHKSKAPACNLVGETSNKQANKQTNAWVRSTEEDQKRNQSPPRGTRCGFQEERLASWTRSHHADLAGGAGLERRGHGGLSTKCVCGPGGSNQTEDGLGGLAGRNFALQGEKCRERGCRGTQHPECGGTVSQGLSSVAMGKQWGLSRAGAG